MRREPVWTCCGLTPCNELIGHLAAKAIKYMKPVDLRATSNEMHDLKGVEPETAATNTHSAARFGSNSSLRR